MSPTTWSSTSSVTPRVLLLHYPVIGPGHGRRYARQAARRSTPRTCRLPQSGRRVCQSVSRHCLSCSIEQRNLWEKTISISQLVLVSRETRTVLTASFLRTPKLRKWSTEQGNLWEKIAQMHGLGPYLMNRQMIIAEYCEKIGHHELQAARAEEERRILQEELWRQQKGFS